MFLVSTIVIIPNCLCGHAKCALYKAYLCMEHKHFSSADIVPYIYVIVLFHYEVIRIIPSKYMGYKYFVSQCVGVFSSL